MRSRHSIRAFVTRSITSSHWLGLVWRRRTRFGERRYAYFRHANGQPAAPVFDALFVRGEIRRGIGNGLDRGSEEPRQAHHEAPVVMSRQGVQRVDADADVDAIDRGKQRVLQRPYD